MKYSGLVLDIDEFKFLHKNELINKFKMLKGLVDRDIPVVLYTDGNGELVENAMKDLNIKEPAIIMEGAKVYSPFQCEYNFEFHLSIKTVKELCFWAKSRNIHFQIITSQGEINYEKWLVKVKSFLFSCEMDECPNVLEVIMDISQEEHNKLLNFISQNYLECYSRVCENKIIFKNLRVDKGTALRCLAKKKKWNLKNFIAIGEYPKDVSLFEEVGLGISIEGEDRETIKNIGKNNKMSALKECINNYF